MGRRITLAWREERSILARSMIGVWSRFHGHCVVTILSPHAYTSRIRNCFGQFHHLCRSSVYTFVSLVMIRGKFSEIQRAVFDVILVEFEDLVHSSEKRVIVLNMRIESVSVSQALNHPQSRFTPHGLRAIKCLYSPVFSTCSTSSLLEERERSEGEEVHNLNPRHLALHPHSYEKHSRGWKGFSCIQIVTGRKLR